jgi:hypothetical protein
MPALPIFRTFRWESELRCESGRRAGLEAQRARKPALHLWDYCCVWTAQPGPAVLIVAQLVFNRVEK